MERQERALPLVLVIATQEMQMSSYVGPNGRLYKRERTTGKWIAITIVSIAVIATAIFGLSNVTAAFRYVGL